MTKGPVLIEIEDETAPEVADAPPVPDTVPSVAPRGEAMQMAARVAARKPSRIGRVFWGLAGALLTAVLSAAAWDFMTGWIARAPIVGWAFTGLLGAFVLTLLVVCLRELAALRRLARLDGLRHAAARATEQNDLSAARIVVDRLDALYRARPDTEWGRARLQELRGDQMDAAGLLKLAESTLVIPLDKAAEREVEAAARQVATVTALVPLALADVVAALTANLRMIRRIAEIYGGRGGLLGSWRLTRAVMAHLVATGAVAVGDDMLEPVLGGSILGKLSRRFGEGLVNGALTARVGVAAMEVCRPLTYLPGDRPKARRLGETGAGRSVSNPERLGSRLVMETFAPDLATMVRTPLTDEHVQAMRRVGAVMEVKAGEHFQRAGERIDTFHYLLTGETEAINSSSGKRYGTATLGPGQFFGELAFLTGGRAFMGGRAVQDTQLLCVPRDEMLKLMSDIPEMSDIIITVFAARRRRMLDLSEGGLTLIGGEVNRDVRRIASFASRNRIPFVEVEIDSAEGNDLANACSIDRAHPAVVFAKHQVIDPPTPARCCRDAGSGYEPAQGRRL